MSARTSPIARIQELVQRRSYRIGLHAVRHMVEEGFDENQLLEAVKGILRIVEEYPVTLSVTRIFPLYAKNSVASAHSV